MTQPTAAAQSEPTSRILNAPRNRICIGNINPGLLHYGFVQSLVTAQSRSVDCDRPIGLLMKPSGPYLDAERNVVVEQFIKELDHDVLVFVDSDISFTWEQLLAVGDACSTEHPVVAGIYINPFQHHGVMPVVFKEEELSKFLPMSFDEIMGGEGGVMGGGPLRSVGAIGTGFMAIHRSLLTAMVDTWGYPMPWFIEPIIDQVHMGEDLGFCLRVRSMGFPILAHTGVLLTHIKQHQFTIANHEAYLAAQRAVESNKELVNVQ